MHPPGRRTPSASITGVGILLAAAALFGLNGTVSKIAMQSGLTSQQLVLLRISGAAIVFVAIAWWRRSRGGPSLRLRRDEIAGVAAFGIVGVVLLQWTYFVAIERLPVGVALLVEYTAPVMVALWVRFGRGEEVRSRVWAALALALTGLALVARLWQGLTLDGVGLVAGFAAAASLAGYYLISEHLLTPSAAGARPPARDPWTLSAWGFGIGAAVWSVLVPWWTVPWPVLADPITVTDHTVGSVPVAGAVLWIVLAGTVLPFSLVLAGITRLGPTRAGLISTSEPVFAALVAFAVLGESLAPVQLLGAATIIGGILLAETARPGADGPSAPAIDTLRT